MNRQKMFLFVLSVLFVAAIAYAYFRTPQQKTVERLRFSSGAVAEPAQREMAKGDGKRLRLDLLDGYVPRFVGFKRNIFSLAPPETRKKLPPPPPPPLPPPPPPQPVMPPPTPPSPVKTEMARFTFLGFLKKESMRKIFLSKDNEIFVVKKGDRIANSYDVTNITDSALTITSTAGGQIIIPLVENMPLAAP